jgi:hypothetical protein
MKHADRLIDQGMLSVFQIRLVKMWERSKGTQHLPEFQAYDFDSIRDLLENIMVCDVDGSKHPPEFIVRSQGKVVTELYGADLSGRRVDDISQFRCGRAYGKIIPPRRAAWCRCSGGKR